MPKGQKLTPKEKRFTEEYIETWNATEAAARAYNCKNRNVANSIWSENLTKPGIEREIEDRVRDAENMIYTIAMTSEKDDTKLKASQDIVDRNKGKATQKVINEWNINVSFIKEEDLVD